MEEQSNKPHSQRHAGRKADRKKSRDQASKIGVSTPGKKTLNPKAFNFNRTGKTQRRSQFKEDKFVILSRPTSK